MPDEQAKLIKRIKPWKIIIPMILGVGVVGWLFYDEFDAKIFSTILLKKQNELISLTMKQKELRKKYDLTASIYDKRYEKIQLEKFNSMLSDTPLSGRKILDLGCGTGLLSDFLKTRRSGFFPIEFNSS